MATMKTLNGYGFNATELNGKAASDYLQKTDTASNSAKLGGKAPEYYLQPRNLLDNSDFRNPVNQRGVTNTSTFGYCIDRWIFSLSGSGTLSVQDGLLAFNTSDGSYCEISQIQENSSALSEKEMTFAVCIAPDNIICLNFTYGTNTSVESADEHISLIHYDGNRVYIRFLSTGNNWIGVKWAALYEGSYTADTLPPYVPKGYAAELAECRLYYRPRQLYCLYCYSAGYVTGTSFEPMRQGVIPTPVNAKAQTMTGDAVSGETTIVVAQTDMISYVANPNFAYGNYYRVFSEFSSDL